MKRVSQTTHLNLEYMSGAGIAQLVEQATENRRVPSSNLGPGTLKPCLLQGLYFLDILRSEFFLNFIFNNSKFLVCNSANFTNHTQN